MVTSATTTAVWQSALIYVGTAGVEASTPLGYVSREQGIEVTGAKSAEKYFVDGLDGPAIIKTTVTGMKFKGKFIQIESDVLKHITGITPVGTVFTVGNAVSQDFQFSVKVIATRRDGTQVIYRSPYTQSVGEPSWLFKSAALTEMDFEWENVDNASSPATITIGSSTTATLASGVLTRTASAGYHLIGGEGGAADVLDSVTGASLTNGERLLLQIASESAPITLTHLLDTLELSPGMDWVMADLDDWILLEYVEADTSWHEVSRFEAIH